jgi:hypothetical protein
MNIENCEQLIEHINLYSNQDDEEGNKHTDFDEDILIVLDIIAIFKKMKEAAVLENNSRIYKAYEKFKKEIMEAERIKISNLISDELYDI